MASRSAITLLLLVPGLVSIAACDRQSPAAEQASAGAPTPEPAGKVDRSHRGEAAPDLAFRDPEGKATRVADFGGKPVLVNLWATWCAPCVREMPSLDALAAREAGRLAVVAVAQDIDPAKVQPFFAARGLKTLAPYTDPELALSVGYAANLPTTILYGPDGREVWRVTGAMDWSGSQARALLAEG